MIIRKAKIADIEACLRISRQRDEKDKYWLKQDLIRNVKDKSAVFLVAEEKGKVTGYCIGYIVPTKRTEAMVHETRVDIEARGKRIGTKLVNALCGALFNKNAKGVCALIEPKVKPFYINSCKFRQMGKWIEASKKK